MLEQQWNGQKASLSVLKYDFILQLQRQQRIFACTAFIFSRSPKWGQVGTSQVEPVTVKDPEPGLVNKIFFWFTFSRQKNGTFLRFNFLFGKKD